MCWSIVLLLSSLWSFGLSLHDDRVLCTCLSPSSFTTVTVIWQSSSAEHGKGTTVLVCFDVRVCGPVVCLRGEGVREAFCKVLFNECHRWMIVWTRALFAFLSERIPHRGDSLWHTDSGLRSHFHRSYQAEYVHNGVIIDVDAIKRPSTTNSKESMDNC